MVGRETDGQMDIMNNYDMVCLYLCLIVVLNLTRQTRCSHIKSTGIAITL